MTNGQNSVQVSSHCNLKWQQLLTQQHGSFWVPYLDFTKADKIQYKYKIKTQNTRSVTNHSKMIDQRQW